MCFVDCCVILLLLKLLLKSVLNCWPVHIYIHYATIISEIKVIAKIKVAPILWPTVYVYACLYYSYIMTVNLARSNVNKQ